MIFFGKCKYFRNSENFVKFLPPYSQLAIESAVLSILYSSYSVDNCDFVCSYSVLYKVKFTYICIMKYFMKY